MRYLDTSIVTCALTGEARTGEIQRWLTQQDPAALAISDWGVAEYSSAIAMKVRTGHLTPEQHAACLASFTRMLTKTLTVLPVEVTSFRAAARFCDQYAMGLRAGDALHLAVCAAHGATLCTLDQRLGQAAPQLGVPVLLP